METRIKYVMSITFGVDIEQISDDASPESIDKWDSLKHMQLILSLEEEFDVEFSDKEVVEVVSYQKILGALRRMTPGTVP